MFRGFVLGIFFEVLGIRVKVRGREYRVNMGMNFFIELVNRVRGGSECLS